MVYKKFIKRDGKTYGPYLYHNVKKDGRVTTHYLGRHDPSKVNPSYNTHKSKKLIMASILSIIVLGLIVVILFHLDFFSTGKASIDIQDVYTVGQHLSGEVRLILKHGELVPQETSLVLDNAGEVYEFPLFSLISSGMAGGNFYVEGKNISGSGVGYGVEGEKEVFPLVAFSFNLAFEKKNVSNVSVSGGSEEIIEPEIVVESPINDSEGNESETIVQEPTNDSNSPETQTSPEQPEITDEPTPPVQETQPIEETTPSSEESNIPESSTNEPSVEISPITGEAIGAEVIEGFVSKTQ